MSDLPAKPPADTPKKISSDGCTRRHVKKSRQLTDGEKMMAKSVFGDAIDLERVMLKTAWWVIKGYAVSPNGHIYFHPSDWREDFSGEPLAVRAWLIHELTHVWQVQQGRAVFWRALFNRRYRYRLDGMRAFGRFGIEQQARMVEDYYVRREQGLDISAWQASVPFLDGTLDDNQDTLV